MRTSLPGIHRRVVRGGTMSPAAERMQIPGPFVVRRFVDFGLTESMMCRVTA